MLSHATHSDQQLVALLKEGSREAFTAIHKKYAASLYRYAYSRTGDKEDSEEIVQEVFISLWNNREALNGTEGISPYLFNSTRWQFLKYVRSKRVRQKYVMDFTLFTATVDNSLQENQNVADLRAAIDLSMKELPEKRQKIFRMRYLEHVPTPDIARQLKITPRTVENNLALALRHLRMSLAVFLK